MTRIIKLVVCFYSLIEAEYFVSAYKLAFETTTLKLLVRPGLSLPSILVLRDVLCLNNLDKVLNI